MTGIGDVKNQIKGFKCPLIKCTMNEMSETHITPYFENVCLNMASIHTGLVKIMLTLMDCGIISSPRNVCPALNGIVARWLLCVKHDGEMVETVL